MTRKTLAFIIGLLVVGGAQAQWAGVTTTDVAGVLVDDAVQKQQIADIAQDYADQITVAADQAVSTATVNPTAWNVARADDALRGAQAATTDAAWAQFDANQALDDASTAVDIATQRQWGQWGQQRIRP